MNVKPSPIELLPAKIFVGILIILPEYPSPLCTEAVVVTRDSSSDTYRYMRGSMMINDYVKVKKETLEDCLTCPLCFDLLMEATTICVCLHTFCKECIYQKFEDDETKCCPMCNVYLGCYPEEKLRPDNNLQDLRMKVFPLKKTKELENMSTLKTTSRKKKRSLSSLVISTSPKVTKPGTSRTRAVTRKSRMSRGTVSKLHDDRDVMVENNHLGPSYSRARFNKFSLVYKKQRISVDKEPSKVAGTSTGPPTQASFSEKDKGPNWERLTVLAETANDLNMPLPDLPAFNSESNVKLNLTSRKRLKRRARESLSDQSNNDLNLENSITPGERPIPSSDAAVKFIDSREQSTTASTAYGFPDNSLKRLYPVWFTLLACNDKKRDPYPQIPKCYIRIKDGNIPVSYVNKYLVQKLNLRHESEVEVMCCGQTLVPSATLKSLVDIWVRFASDIDGSICESNSNRHNFVMVLTYRRT